MNYKILFGNLILVLIVILIILFIVFKKKIESFIGVGQEGCPAPEDYSDPSSGEDSSGGGLGPMDPTNYNPQNYNMCKNVGWVDNGNVFKKNPNQTWYDAEVECKKDFNCQSFATFGDSSTTSGRVLYYSNSNPTEVSDSQWSSQNKPNLYVKTTQPCMKTIPVTIFNENSSGNLKSTDTVTGMPYKYENDFITDTRVMLNDYNDFRIAKDSGQNMTNFFS